MSAEKVAFGAYPLGFCAGVKYAVRETYNALDKYGAVYVFGERIVDVTCPLVENVHNRIEQVNFADEPVDFFHTRPKIEDHRKVMR